MLLAFSVDRNDGKVVVFTSLGWDEMKFKRGACCATFRLKGVRGDRRIFVMISHFPLGKEARLNIAPLIVEMEKKYNPDGLPSFFMGDLNTREERPESFILREWWSDSFLSLDGEAKSGPKGTFNNHGVNTDMEAAPHKPCLYYIVSTPHAAQRHVYTVRSECLKLILKK